MLLIELPPDVICKIYTLMGFESLVAIGKRHEKAIIEKFRNEVRRTMRWLYNFRSTCNVLYTMTTAMFMEMKKKSKLMIRHTYRHGKGLGEGPEELKSLRQHLFLLLALKSGVTLQSAERAWRLRAAEERRIFSFSDSKILNSCISK